MGKANKERNFDALIGLVAIIFGIIYGVTTLMLPRATVGKPLSPLYFPLILAGFMCFFGVVLLIKSDIKESVRSLKSLKNRNLTEKLNNRQILFTCIVSVVYAVIFHSLGYVIATFLFMEAMLFLTNGKEKWLVNTLVSVAFSIGVYILFATFLGISLPPLPFLYI